VRGPAKNESGKDQGEGTGWYIGKEGENVVFITRLSFFISRRELLRIKLNSSKKGLLMVQTMEKKKGGNVFRMGGSGKEDPTGRRSRGPKGKVGWGYRAIALASAQQKKPWKKC